MRKLLTGTIILMAVMSACSSGQNVSDTTLTPATTQVEVATSTTAATTTPTTETVATTTSTTVVPDNSRLLAHPVDAVCVDSEIYATTGRAVVLNNLMRGNYGPIGDWVSGDIGGSMQIGDSEQWVFFLGDSIMGENDGSHVPAQISWIHNAMLVQDHNCFWVEHGYAGNKPRSLIDTGDDSYYWPGDGYIVDNTMYLWLVQVRLTGTGMFGFTPFDQDLAIIDLDAWNFTAPIIVDEGVWDNKEMGSSVDGEEPGQQVLPFTYAKDKGPVGTYMARIADGDPTAWLFWDGSAWTADENAAVAVSGLEPGEYNGKIQLFELAGRWTTLRWSWTVAGIKYQVVDAEELTGPYSAVVEAPAMPLRPEDPVAIQYNHNVEGTYRIDSQTVLMEWANNADAIGAGTLVYKLRPSFTSFDLGHLDAAPLL